MRGHYRIPRAVIGLVTVALCFTLAGQISTASSSTPRLTWAVAKHKLHQIEEQQRLAPGGNWTVSSDDCERKSPRHIRCWYALLDYSTNPPYDCPYLFDAYRHIGSKQPTFSDVLNGRCRYTGPQR